MYLHSAIDGHTRLAYTEPLADEKATTAIGFLHRARAWFAAHGITHIEQVVTDNGACYRADAFTRSLLGARHKRTKPYTPQHNGKVERYNRILAEEFLYVRTWTRTRSVCGTRTTTITALTVRLADGRLPPCSTSVSRTSWPHTASDR